MVGTHEVVRGSFGGGIGASRGVGSDLDEELISPHFGLARPNRAHEVLARLEAAGTLKVLIVQNIDSVFGRTESRSKNSSSQNVLFYHRRALYPHNLTFRKSVGGSIRMPLNTLRSNRCRSPEMMYFASAATPHSMNLLSAGS